MLENIIEFSHALVPVLLRESPKQYVTPQAAGMRSYFGQQADFLGGGCTRYTLRQMQEWVLNAQHGKERRGL